MLKTLSAIVVVVALAGCASKPIPPLSYSVQGVGVTKSKKQAELKSLTVNVASASEMTGKVIPSIDRTPAMWKSALEEALNNMIIFQDDAAKKVNLTVKITEFDPPPGGVDMTTKVAARYEIIDRSNGDIIFSQLIATTGTVAFSENILGVARIIESTNIAVRENIKQFLQALEEVDTNKPMFPANMKVKK